MVPTSLDESLAGRMRASVAAVVQRRGPRLRTMSAPALIGVLSASALVPVIAAAGGAGLVLAAGAGVLGSVGANFLTTVLTDAVARLRVTTGGAPPSEEQFAAAVAARVEAAFSAAGPADRELRGEVVALFRAVDVAGTALRTAAAVDEELVPAMAVAFSDLTVLFGEFAFVLASSRLALEDLHREVRQEVARQSADRERSRRAEAGIGQILDGVRDLQARHGSAAGTGDRPAVARWEGCPYRGLLAFEERDAAVFYGRRTLTSRLVDRLAERLTGTGMLVVLGPSGAGKSSLLRAGLMAALADDRLAAGCRAWPRRVITPTADPMAQLATHLADVAGIDAIAAHRSLAADPGRAHLLAAQALPPARPGAEPPRLVLVVDQLEELFTLVGDQDRRDAFVTALHCLATVAARPGGQPAALVVAGIRGDFLDQALTFAPLREAVEAGPFTVGAMSEAELAEAVTGPAAAAGRAVPDDLTRAVLDDLRDRNLPVGFDSGVLPLLSQVMFVLWQAGDGREMTVERYRRTGGVAGIVHTSAERVYQSLADDQREIARRVFAHLTTTLDGRVTRRPATRAALLAAAGCTAARLETVLEAFTAQRLITRADNDMVSIAHEVLLHSWATMRDWLQPSLTDQALHRALVDDVQAWLGHQLDPSYLYQGGQLVAVRDAVHRWTTEPAGRLGVDPATVAFLEAGRRRDRHRQRIARSAAGVLAALLLLTSAATVIAGRTAARADRSAAEADRQHAVALSRQLAAESRAVRATNRITSLRLAAAALHVAGTSEAHDAVGAGFADYANIICAVGTVATVAFSPDGHLLATAGDDHLVRLWDPDTGRLAGPPLAGHDGTVESVAFSPDGRLLATAGADHTVRLWDPRTGKVVHGPLVDHDGTVASVAFSPDGRRLATSGSDHTARLWDPATGKVVRVLRPSETGEVSAVAFSPDGRLLATAGGDHTVQLWNPETGAPAGDPLAGHTSAVYAVAFSPNGRWLATAGNDGTVRLWDPRTGQPALAPITGHTGAVHALAFSPDNRTLATAGDDHTVRLWDPETGKARGLITGHTDAVRTLAFSADGTRLATAGADHAVRLWNPETGQPPRAVLTGHTDGVDAVRFSVDGRRLSTVGVDGTVRLWDRATSRPLGAPLTGHWSSAAGVAFSPDWRLVAAAGDDRTVQLWDPALGTPVGAALSGHTDIVRAVAFSPNGQILATAGDDNSVRMWDTATHRSYSGLLQGHQTPVGSVVFSPAGDRLATASADGTVLLWEPATGLRIAELTGHGKGVTAMAFSPDGRRLATADAGGTVRLWDPRAGQPVSALPGHTDTVRAMAFSVDGRLLATAGADHTVRLWNPSTGQPAGAPLIGHTAAVRAVAFSADGRLLATAGADRTVRLWNPGTGQPAGIPIVGHSGAVHAVAFDPEGRLLATAGADRTVRVWGAAAFADPIRSLCDQAGAITAEEWATYAAGEPPVEVCP